jgi:hypothetical protein
MKTLFLMMTILLVVFFLIFHFRIFTPNAMLIAALVLSSIILLASLIIFFGSGIAQLLVLIVAIAIAFLYFQNYQFGRYLENVSKVMQSSINGIASNLSSITANAIVGNCDVCIVDDDGNCVVCNSEGNK